MRLISYIVLVAIALAALPTEEAAAQRRRRRQDRGNDRKAQVDPTAASKALTAAADAVSLPELLDVAVRTSPRLELARIDVEIAEGAVLAAAGLDDWLLAATASWVSVRADPIAGSFVQTTSQNRAIVDASLTRSLPWGGVAEISTGGSFDRSEGLADNPMTPEYDPFPFETTSYGAAATVRYTQSLLRGFGSDVARANQALARIDRSAAELAREAEAINVVRDLITAYWDLALAYRQLAINESSLALQQERLRITEAQVRAGAKAPSEALAVRQAIATQRAQIVVARFGIIDRSLNLRRLAGLEIEPGHIALATKAPIEPKTRDYDIASVIDQSLATSPAIAQLEAREQGATIDVTVTENGMLPRLDLSVYFGPSGSDDNLGGAYEDVASFDFYEFGGSLTFEHWLGNNEAEGLARQARARRRAVKINLVDARRQVIAAAVRAVELAQTARERMEIGELAIELAERNIEAETARFDLGRATNFDVLQRQEELKQARLNYARAAIDYLSATAQIESLTGELLPRYGISVDAP